jgi:hypothetical protein
VVVAVALVAHSSDHHGFVVGNLEQGNIAGAAKQDSRVRKNNSGS